MTFLFESSRRAHRRARRAVLLTATAVLLSSTMPAHAQKPTANPATAQAARRIADRVLADARFQFVDTATQARYASLAAVPDNVTGLRIASEYNDWRYWNGVLNIAMLRLADVASDAKYADFAERNVAFAFASYPWFERRYARQDKWSYPFAQRFIMRELDDYGAMGASVLDVHARAPHAEYRAYALEGATYALEQQGRLDDGTLVRNFPHRWTLWADDLFMSVPLLARVGALTGETRWFDDAAKQVVNFHRYLFDTDRGIMVHNWYSDVERPGVAFWGRANGWALAAQVELLDRLPADHPQRDELLSLLRRHILGIARWQSLDGLWHQLLDKPDSYLETSASAMFVYAIARAVHNGYIEPRYLSIAERGWSGVLTRIRPDGQIEGICTGTVVSDNLVDYYTRPTPLNDVHGVATVLLAATEMMRVTASGRSPPPAPTH